MMRLQKRPDVSIKLVLRAQQRILMLHRTDGSYDFPGGRLEWGESPEETLKRELIEEIAYELPSAPVFFDIYNYIAKDGSRHSMFLHYYLSLDHVPKLSTTAEEADAEVVWLSKQELQAIIQDPAFIERVLD